MPGVRQIAQVEVFSWYEGGGSFGKGSPAFSDIVRGIVCSSAL